MDTNTADKPEPKSEPKSDPKSDPKSEPRSDPKSEPKPDPKSETKSVAKSRPKILWDEGGRALICMLPCLIFGLMGNYALAIPTGQAGFFFSSMPLPQKKSKRLLFASLMLTVGLGYYLMGGNVVFNPWVSIFFTFFLALNLALMVSWEVAGILALSFFTIYSAGLNASSPDKVHQSFMAFLFAMGWAGAISLLSIWKGQATNPMPKYEPAQYVETGVKLGLGTSIALFVANLFHYSKLGWAPSAVGNVVRFDEVISKKRAAGRIIATIGGAVIATIALIVFKDVTVLLIFAIFFAILNGLSKSTKLGQMPLFYTATILILYSLNSLGDPNGLIAQRIAYNVVGVLIGLFVVLYPFPIISRKIKATIKPKPVIDPQF